MVTTHVEVISTMFRLIDEFVDQIKFASLARNKWIESSDNDPECQLYLRYTKRGLNVIPGYAFSFFDTIELADISVHPSYQRMGICKSILSHLQHLALENRRVLYVENVFSQELERHLIRHEFICTGRTPSVEGMPLSYVWWPSVSSLTKTRR